MLRECCRCKVIYGEKEPLEDRSVTSGFCPQCYTKEMKMIVENQQKIDAIPVDDPDRPEKINRIYEAWT